MIVVARLVTNRPSHADVSMRPDSALVRHASSAGSNNTVNAKQRRMPRPTNSPDPGASGSRQQQGAEVAAVVTWASHDAQRRARHPARGVFGRTPRVPRSSEVPQVQHHDAIDAQAEEHPRRAARRRRQAPRS